jgi:hypothetical protein
MTARQCPYCELRFATSSELESHLVVDHPQRITLAGHAPAPGRLTAPVRSARHVPRTWAEAEQMTADFEALLRKYHGRYQDAVDASRRGEHADTDGTAMSNPM